MAVLKFLALLVFKLSGKESDTNLLLLVPRKSGFLIWIEIAVEQNTTERVEVRGQGRGLQKYPMPRPRTDFLRADPIETKDGPLSGPRPRTKNTIFQNYWSANFRLFLNPKVFKSMAFR